jgi:16S rRNA (guanine527-N7)-methyltransferase
MTLNLHDYLEEMSVSRETKRSIDTVVEQVQRWNPTINLVSKGSLQDAAQRHCLDSAQLFAIAPIKSGRWVDLGSGGGFPGLIVAILARELAPGIGVTLVEADKRKATFLKLTAAGLDLNVDVLAERIEHCAPFKADVLSARALASLDVLCHYGKMHLAKSGTALFPKGAAYDQEIVVARRAWSFGLEVIQSVTDDAAKVLKIKDISCV